MIVEIVMPKMGESIQEGTVLHWTKSVGEYINKDETLLEISTDKVDSEIPSPVQGIVSKILAHEQDVVPVGSVIALIETEATHKAEENKYSEPSSSVLYRRREKENVYTRGDRKQPSTTAHRFYSPVVRSIASKEKIDSVELDSLVGTGSQGRVTKKDILAYVSQRAAIGKNVFHPTKNYSPVPISLDELSIKYPEPKYHIVQMDTIQIRMAEHMSRSLATSAHVTVVDEVDVNSIALYREREGKRLEERENVKITFTSFFAHAVIKTLKKFLILNSSLEGDKIIYKNFINLGMAVASPAGLLVPVIKDAELKNFLGLTRAIHDLTVRAREKKLLPDDIADGTFSITNYGVFGNIIGTPIINQPQTAILGIGAVKKRPVVVSDEHGNDSLVIRSMVYLTVSFDHRIIDGAIGGKFLAQVRENIENFDFEEVK